MDNTFKIKQLSKEYFVTLDGKPVCPGISSEEIDYVPPIYAPFVELFGSERVKLVCVTTFDEDDVKEDGEDPK